MPVNYLGDVSRAIKRHKKIKKFLKIQQQVAFLTANLHNKKLTKLWSAVNWYLTWVQEVRFHFRGNRIGEKCVTNCQNKLVDQHFRTSYANQH